MRQKLRAVQWCSSKNSKVITWLYSRNVTSAINDIVKRRETASICFPCSDLKGGGGIITTSDKQERGPPFADCDWPQPLSITKEEACLARPLRQARLFSGTSACVCRVWQVYPDYHGDRSEKLVDISIRSCRLLGSCRGRTPNLPTHWQM